MKIQTDVLLQRQPNIFVLFQLWVVTMLTGYVGQDTVIEDSLPQSQPPEQDRREYGTHMHILLRKICRDTL